jgi:hypothetical protein
VKQLKLRGKCHVTNSSETIQVTVHKWHRMPFYCCPQSLFETLALSTGRCQIADDCSKFWQLEPVEKVDLATRFAWNPSLPRPVTSLGCEVSQSLTERMRTTSKSGALLPAIHFDLNPPSSTLSMCQISYILIAIRDTAAGAADSSSSTHRYLTYYRKQIRVVGFVARDRFYFSTHSYLNPSCLAV